MIQEIQIEFNRLIFRNGYKTQISKIRKDRKYNLVCFQSQEIINSIAITNQKCSQQKYMCYAKAFEIYKHNKSKKSYDCKACQGNHNLEGLYVHYVVLAAYKKRKKMMKFVQTKLQENKILCSPSFLQNRQQEDGQLTEFSKRLFSHLLNHQSQKIKQICMENQNFCIFKLRSMLKDYYSVINSLCQSNQFDFICCRNITQYGVQGAIIYSRNGFEMLEFINQKQEPLRMPDHILIMNVGNGNIAVLNLNVSDADSVDNLLMGNIKQDRRDGKKIIMHPIGTKPHSRRSWVTGGYDSRSKTFFMIGGKREKKILTEIQYLTIEQGIIPSKLQWRVGPQLDHGRSTASAILSSNCLFLIGGEYQSSANRHGFFSNIMAVQNVSSEPKVLMLQQQNVKTKFMADKIKWFDYSDSHPNLRSAYPRLVQIPQMMDYKYGAIIVYGGTTDPYMDYTQNRRQLNKAVIYNPEDQYNTFHDIQFQEQQKLNQNQSLNEFLSFTPDYGALVISSQQIIWLQAMRKKYKNCCACYSFNARTKKISYKIHRI